MSIFRTRICFTKGGGTCPRCGQMTEREYTGARNCYEPDGGCGWSDYTPEMCATPPEGWWCPREPEHDGPCAAKKKEPTA